MKMKFFLGIFILIFAFFTLYPLHSTLPIQAASNSKCTLVGSFPRVINAIISGGVFAGKTYTQTGECIEDKNAAYIREVPTYDRLLKDYYTDASTNDYVNKNDTNILDNQTQNNFPFTAKNQLYHFTKDVTVSAKPPNSNNVGIVFIDGNLRFTGNYLYDAPAGTSYQRGTVFVVRGNIYIEKDLGDDSAADQIDAVLISSGTIYTEVVDDATQCSGLNPDSDSQALTINGNLIALNPLKPIELCRNLPDDGTLAAEKVNLQAKYLVILKNTFSETLNVLTEDTNFSADTSFVTQPPGGPAPLGVTVTASPNPVNTSTNITWTANVTGGNPSLTYSWSCAQAPGASTCTSSTNVLTNQFSSGGYKMPTVTVTDATPIQVQASGTAYVNYPFLRAFATNQTYQGNLATLGAGTGANPGVDGANKLCQLAANNANLGGTWKAWISSNSYSAATNLGYISTSGPFRQTDNTTVIKNTYALLTVTGAAPLIEKDEYVLPLNVDVWTNTFYNGNIEDSTTTGACTNWTVNTSGTSPKGNTGKTGSNGNKWTSDANITCDKYASLYCFEVSNSPLPTPPAPQGPIYFTAQPTLTSSSASNLTFSFTTNICPSQFTAYYRRVNDQTFTNEVIQSPVCTPSGSYFTASYQVRSLPAGTKVYFKTTVEESGGYSLTSNLTYGITENPE